MASEDDKYLPEYAEAAELGGANGPYRAHNDGVRAAVELVQREMSWLRRAREQALRDKEAWFLVCKSVASELGLSDWLAGDLAPAVASLKAQHAAAAAGPTGERSAPILMLLHCPMCSARHLDEGEFATKPHHTHACQECGHCWRPAIVPTVGVQFLPGFKNGE